MEIQRNESASRFDYSEEEDNVTAKRKQFWGATMLKEVNVDGGVNAEVLCWGGDASRSTQQNVTPKWQCLGVKASKPTQRNQHPIYVDGFTHSFSPEPKKKKHTRTRHRIVSSFPSKNRYAVFDDSFQPSFPHSPIYSSPRSQRSNSAIYLPLLF